MNDSLSVSLKDLNFKLETGKQQKHQSKGTLDMSRNKKAKSNGNKHEYIESWDYSLYLLGIFVANEYDDWVDVNAVKTLDGVRDNVK